MSDDNDGINRRLEAIHADLRDLVKERRELSILLMDITRFVQRKPGPPEEISADRRASDQDLLRRLASLRKDVAEIWEMYAFLNKRIDDRDRRLDEIERRLDKLEGVDPPGFVP